jgi:hypothetical protein
MARPPLPNQKRLLQLKLSHTEAERASRSAAKASVGPPGVIHLQPASRVVTALGDTSSQYAAPRRDFRHRQNQMDYSIQKGSLRMKLRGATYGRLFCNWDGGPLTRPVLVVAEIPFGCRLRNSKGTLK